MSEPTRAECDGLCIHSADIGVPGYGVAYPHPGCPLHAPKERCQCGRPDRCTSYTHDPAWLATQPTKPAVVQWVQDEPRPDTPEDREHRTAEAERDRQVKACGQSPDGHLWWLELEHPDDGAGVTLSCDRCPAGINDLYPDGIDLIGGDLEGVSVDAGRHDSPTPLLIPVDAEVTVRYMNTPISGADCEVEFIVTPRGPAQPVAPVGAGEENRP